MSSLSASSFPLVNMSFASGMGSVSSAAAASAAAESAATVNVNGLDVSPLDTRAYRSVVLENGLSALLVSDTHGDTAAAALDVAVGHFSDPDAIPGVAHFCEHMLFLGTEKYPDEGSYRQFLAENGGYSNAYTSMENTNYHFHVVAGKFREALDRFSQFFVAPLFTSDATEREMKAVDSEHQKNLQSDAHRLFQLRKSSASPNHPFSKFGTGSFDTLRDIPAVRAALLEFHSKFYFAPAMTLCVVSPDSLDTLQEWVTELFSGVRSKPQVPEEAAVCANGAAAEADAAVDPVSSYRDLVPFESAQLAKTYYIAPVKELRLLELVWVTAALKPLYRVKPANYIAHLLGHEGQGSLLSLLKARGWADGLSAGPGMSTETFGTFDVSVELTAAGVEHRDEIITLIFGYLRLIREQGIQKWVWDECKATAEMSFRFHEREEPIKLASRLSSEASSYPMEHSLAGPFLYYEYSPDTIRSVLDVMVPEHVWICVLSSEVAQQRSLELAEKWYKTPYDVEDISKELQGQWRNAEVAEELRIPSPNAFIPTDFNLLSSENADGGDEKAKHPHVVRQDERWRVHFHQDDTFKRPKANVYIELVSSAAYQSPRHAVLTNLFTLLLMDELNEFSYDAEIAGLHYGLSNMMTGMRLLVRGYNHRLLVLLRAIVEKMASRSVDADRFARVRDSMQRDYANFFMEQPYQHALYAVSYCTQVPRWHVRDYVDVSKTITVDELEKFIPSLFERMHIEMLVHGNMHKEDALGVAALVDEVVPFGSMFEGEFPERRVVELPVGPDGVVWRASVPNPDDHNSAIENFYQASPLSGTSDHRDDVLLELLAEVMNKPCFHQLRTVEQLGYMVFSGVDRVDNSQGLRILVQSTVATPIELDERIEQFLVSFEESTLAKMTQEELAVYAKSLITLKLEKVKRLTQQTNRWWAEITDRRYQYDRHEREAALLAEIQVSELQAFFNTYIARQGSLRRKMSSQMFGNAHPIPSDNSTQPVGAAVITDAIKFRNSRPLLACVEAVAPPVAAEGAKEQHIGV